MNDIAHETTPQVSDELRLLDGAFLAIDTVQWYLIDGFAAFERLADHFEALGKLLAEAARGAVQPDDVTALLGSIKHETDAMRAAGAAFTAARTGRGSAGHRRGSRRR